MNILRKSSVIRKWMLATLGVLLAAIGVYAQDEGSAVSEEMAAEFAEQFDAIFDGPNIDIADTIFAPDFVGHAPLAPDLDREGWKGYVASFYAAFPDLTEEVNQVIVSKDRVVLHVTYTGTHDGPLFGIEPTGKTITMEGVGIFRFNEDGLAVENWAVLDIAAILAQIGAFPSAPASEVANPLPAPTGPYNVGVAWRQWVDEARDEPYDETANDKREVIVQFLYPAVTVADTEAAPYLQNRDDVIPMFSNLLEAFVSFRFDTQPSDLDHFQSHAYAGAALASDQASYPVLIFSPGAASDVRMYTAQLEELASHGYIVAAINHAYGVSITTLSDGRVVSPTFSTGLEGAAEIWSQDQIFVIDQLEALNANDPDGLFTNRLDLERLGIFGQSLGGSTSTLTCFVDTRCKAGANGDGEVYGSVIEQGLEQPFLYLLSDSRIFSDPAFFAASTGPYYEVAVQGFEHLDFGDFPLWPGLDPVIEASWLGDTDGARAVELTRAALLTFFDRYVKGETESTLDALDAYPEITVTARNSS